ncbi:SCO2400 family protein [Streptomyces neyagawaensis]|uniref:Uncharacterized protein n=1 Tax=Streptomyces neyagawaensis TaxID=42238 RepID=A0ABV3B492_9ACTN
MDYCSSCRRHLNGALVCPGCGAYAPDIAPSAPGTTTAMAVAPTVPSATWEYAASGAEETWHDGGRPEPELEPTAGPSTELVPAGVAHAEGADDIEGVHGVEDVQGVPVAPRGRAARRRQMARWKKNQRRAVVATAVALVGGGLTVMGMDRQSTDRTQAATAPDAEGLRAVEEQGSQSGQTPDTRPDETRRSPDTSRGHARGGSSYDGSGAQQGNTGGDTGSGNAPRTATTPPSGQRAQSGSSSHGGSSADGSTDTPAGGATTPPATDDSTGSGAGSGADTGTGAGSGSGSGNGSGTETGTGSDSGTGTGSSGGSGSSDSDATSPSGLCLLGGIVCVS